VSRGEESAAAASAVPGGKTIAFTTEKSGLSAATVRSGGGEVGAEVERGAGGS
jgi:hypothetical protein